MIFTLKILPSPNGELGGRKIDVKVAHCEDKISTSNLTPSLISVSSKTTGNDNKNFDNGRR